MRYRPQIPFQLAAISALVMAASGARAQGEASPEPRYRPLELAALPASHTAPGDYRGELELGIGYVNDDNFMFGQYNGLQEEGASLIGNLRWQDYRGEGQWRVSVSDLGLDTREGEVRWVGEGLNLAFGFDSQQQVRNDSGKTPFRGDSALRLPDNWVSESTTGEFSQLEAALHGFDRELSRDRLFASASSPLGANWQLDGEISYEEKQGTGDTAGAMYVDASSGDAAFLPVDVDYRTSEFALGLNYSGDSLSLEGRLDYSDFDNRDDILIWQNPYRSRYPDSAGGMGQAPDNEQWQGRITGLYAVSPSARFQFDGSYAVASQDDDYLDYSVNPAATITEPLPRGSFDGEAETATLNALAWVRATQQLDLEFYYQGRERDYDTPRDGYTYIRGDGLRQPRQALTVYNTAHHYQSQTLGAEATWRLARRTRVGVEYAYEQVERENAAVEETQEDRLTLSLRAQPMGALSARLEFGYANRAADTYHWDQRYYALLDVELINATPANQRYINHPELSQFHLANRERSHGKLDLNWLPAEAWLINFNLLLQADDFDKSYLGLRDAWWQRYHLSASYNPAADVSATLYGGYDRYESEQMGRAFRGGADKNAFEIYYPPPQASDPDRDWRLDTTDEAVTVGANVHWQVAENLALEADYSHVDTEGEQDFRTYGAGDLDPQDLPGVETTLHHFRAAGTWQLREALALKLEYQYYRYDADDWALQGVAADSIDKVLTFGAHNPDEKIHYVGVSALYRWQ